MARTASTKKRRWAWTLMIAADLLGVVWLGSVKIYAFADLPWRSSALDIRDGCLSISWEDSQSRWPVDVEFRMTQKRGPLRWWFDFEQAPSKVVGQEWTRLQIPLWPFVLLTGVPGVWMLVKTRQRTNPHACPACGYDRTGLPQTSTGPAPCPECGAGKDDDAVKG